jgi:hypothetical protein
VRVKGKQKMAQESREETEVSSCFVTSRDDEKRGRVCCC